jgi:RNA polymerase sigma-70 factor, ECF subfamily
MIIAPRQDSGDSSKAETAGALSNEELVHRLRTDPQRAAPVLYARYEPRVRWLVRRMLGADTEQHDLVQQIFFDLMKSGFELREPDKLPSWIRSITMRSVYEELRRRRMRRAMESNLTTPTTRDFVRDVETRDLLVRATRMIEQLPRLERIAFTLRVVEGRTCHEVATIEGCSPATIKRRLARANRRLQSMMAHHRELRELARGTRGRRWRTGMARPQLAQAASPSN